MAPLPGEGREGAVTDEERAAHEAAMTENQLLRAVLDDLKGEGCAPASMSNGRKTELGEGLRRETGLPLREITASLRISRSSYEYQRARPGRDRDAALGGPVREAFEEGRGCYGYRRVHAALRLRGERVSEKRVRRVMREEGLEAARPRRRRYSSYAGEPDGRPANAPRERAEARRAAGEAYAPDHDFSAQAPGSLAVTDVSELPACGTKLYLSLRSSTASTGCRPPGGSRATRTRRCATARSRPTWTACRRAPRRPSTPTGAGPTGPRAGRGSARGGASRARCRGAGAAGATPGRRGSSARSRSSSSTGATGRARAPTSSAPRSRTTWGGAKRGGSSCSRSRTGRGATRPSWAAGAGWD